MASFVCKEQSGRMMSLSSRGVHQYDPIIDEWHNVASNVESWIKHRGDCKIDGSFHVFKIEVEYYGKPVKLSFVHDTSTDEEYWVAKYAGMNIEGPKAGHCLQLIYANELYMASPTTVQTM